MTSETGDLDLVVWGATGFTGRLVAEHLLAHHGAGADLRWALGGRSQERLEAVRRDLGPAAAGLPLAIADAHDDASLKALVGGARVICSTVGPYAKYGSKLVAACARGGTHYCDLTGEVQWMRRMIDAHHDEARQSGARIVHACGFDSIPSDLGVAFMHQAMQERHGVPCGQIKYRVKRIRGGASGGTVASMINLLAEASQDREVRRILADPYALNPAPKRSGPDGRDLAKPAWDSDFEAWIAPFVMASVNTRVVRRTNALLEGAYGDGFRYDEATLMGRGARGFLKAVGLVGVLGGVVATGSTRIGRGVLRRLLPAPGEGPDRARREAGGFEIRLLGIHAEDPQKRLWGRVTGDRDPGYGSTSRMLGESAVCLAKDGLTASGGFWTPASLMAEPLLARLQARAGLTFSIDDG